MTLSGILAEQFNALQGEYNRFYHIRNYPTQRVEYDDRELLTEMQRDAWIQRLNDQTQEISIHLGQITASAELLGQSDELRSYRPFHEMKAYLREDVQELKQQLGQFGFAPHI